MSESTNKQESTALAVDQQKERPAHLFKPGQSGNPKGREKGSKNKVSKAYLKAIAKDFDKYGAQVIERVRVETPAIYLKLVAQLISKDIDVNHDGGVTVNIVRFGRNPEVENQSQGTCNTDNTRSLRAI